MARRAQKRRSPTASSEAVRALHFERFLDVWKAHIRDQLSLHERMAQDRHARVRQHVRHALELNKKFERKLKLLDKTKGR